MNAQHFDILATQLAMKELMKLQKHLYDTSLVLTDSQECAVSMALTKVARLAMSNMAKLSKGGLDISEADKPEELQTEAKQ